MPRSPGRPAKQCHVSGKAKKTWQRVATTAGPPGPSRVGFLGAQGRGLPHLPCAHGAPVPAGRHHLRPAGMPPHRRGRGSSWGGWPPGSQPENLDPNEEQLYCNSCHQFTAEAQFVTLDSAGSTLRPGEGQCFGCHEMRTLLAEFDPAKDPHSGSCGMCHNPHTDVEAGRRDEVLRRRPMSRRLAGGGVPRGRGPPEGGRSAARPATSRTRPGWTRATAPGATSPSGRVEESSSLRSPSTPPRPSSRRSAWSSPADPAGRGDAPPPDDPVETSIAPAASPTDTFSHKQHRRLACITCHTTTSPTRRLTFEPPRGCQICHHQRPASSDCATCHQSDELSQPDAGHGISDGAPAASSPARSPLRARGTREGRVHRLPHHAGEPRAASRRWRPAPPATRSIMSHGWTAPPATGRRRSSTAHAPPIDAHQACDQCHAERTVAALEPTRSFCLACHGDETDHYAEKECTVCHLQASPEAYRARLTSVGRGP